MIFAGILAGGKGTRMGVQDMPKQFLMLGNKPIIIHTIEKFLLISQFKKIVVGVHPDWLSYMEDLIEKYLSFAASDILVVEGGGDRNQTIENIITNIKLRYVITDNDVIVTHDSVRPFISLKSIKENIRLIGDYDCVDTVVEATDTIVQSTDHECISDIPERQYFYQGQTPQTFRMKEFMMLYQNLPNSDKTLLTDACKIFVINGKTVALARGDYSNIKITTVTDLKIARGMIEEN